MKNSHIELSTNEVNLYRFLNEEKNKKQDRIKQTYSASLSSHQVS